MNIEKLKKAAMRYRSVFVAKKFRGFKRPSRFGFKSYYWAHAVYARDYQYRQKTTLTRLIGRRVQIAKQQNRIGGAKCPGRTGTVAGLNGCDNTLIYVDLDATKRAKERRETFWLSELAFV